MNTELQLTQIRTDGGTQSRAQAARLRKRMLGTDSACAVCGFPIHNVLQMHHVIPLAKGGENTGHNLVFLCPTCHELVHESARRCYADANASSAKQKEAFNLYLQFKNALIEVYGEEQADYIIYLGSQAR